MSTELAIPQAQIERVRERIIRLIPNAGEAPPDVVMAAAQLAIAYHLDPFSGEIQIIPTGSKKVGEHWVTEYRAHVGIKGLRKKAREQAHFMTEFRTLTADETKASRREQFDPLDIGVECTLYRMDIAQQCQRLGMEYKPFRGTGFWRAKAVKRSDGWKPDNIPNTWTAHDVAEKRAEINAIRKAYDLTISVADPAAIDEDQAIQVLDERVEVIEQDRAPVYREPVYYDELENLVPGSQVVEAETDGNDYHAIAETLTDKARLLAEWCYKQDRATGTEGASKAQYGYLVSALDALTGEKHGYLLRVLCRRPVDAQHPPSKLLASRLLDYTLKQVPDRAEDGEPVKGEDGKTVYVDNPKYREDVCETLAAIAGGGENGK